MIGKLLVDIFSSFYLSNETLGPDGDTSVGLEPVEVFCDPSKASGGARLAAQRGDE